MILDPHTSAHGVLDMGGNALAKVLLPNKMTVREDSPGIAKIAYSRSGECWGGQWDDELDDEWW